MPDTVIRVSNLRKEFDGGRVVALDRNGAAVGAQQSRRPGHRHILRRVRRDVEHPRLRVELRIARDDIGEYSLVAGDIIEYLPEAFNALDGSGTES